MPRNPPSDLTVFSAALELRTPHERQAYLDTACGCDTHLREKIAALLAAAEGGADALDRFGGLGVSAPGGLETPGQMIGRYKVMKQLGEGGHGVVYEAEQEEPIRRRVALKVIKAGMDTKAVIARFEAERQALAMMDHPNIAKVFDAGSTDTGRPYFVMEVANGAKITDYCRQHNLPVRDRLTLFLQVCDAVQHAHQKGIIHRDLKPPNILVRAEVALDGGSAGPVDPDGAARSPDASGREPPDAKGSALLTIIDFGIAKSLAAPLTESTIHTGLHQLVGTPAYMSPEQADLRQDLDTRTDIYSLGVLLYELLTGRPPFDNHELLTAGLDEMRRIIREVEPWQPSQCLKSQIRSRNAALDPDLDSIVLKCLEKDRSRRYETAASLAEDIRRHLRREPVLARPPSTTYRLGRFVRRNRTVCISAGLVAFAIVTGALLAVHGLARERRSRQNAEHRLHTALAFVNEITDDLLPKLERLPGASALNESWARAALRFATNLLQSAGTDPETAFAAANVLVRLGRTEITTAANNLGRPERALTHAREAIAVLERVHPDYRTEERLRLLKEARNREAVALEHLGQSEKAIQIRETEVAPLIQRLVDLHPDQLRPREEQIYNRSMIGLDLIQLDRERDGIGQHLLPLLETAWARSLTTNSESYSLRSLASIHGPLAVAYTRLQDWPSVIHHAGEAARWTAVLAEREPDNLNHLLFLSSMNSFKAYALVRSEASAEGLAELTLARQRTADLLERDPAHAGLREAAGIVLLHRARALAFLASAANTALDQRQERLAEATQDLARVDAIIGRAEQPPRVKQFVKDLEDARSEVRAAEARFRQGDALQPLPRPSPQPSPP